MLLAPSLLIWPADMPPALPPMPLLPPLCAKPDMDVHASKQAVAVATNPAVVIVVSQKIDSMPRSYEEVLLA